MTIHEYLTKFREERQETPSDMARKLHVKPSTLCVVESHSRPFPEAWYGRFRREYGLSDMKVNELRACVAGGTLLSEIEWTTTSGMTPMGFSTYMLDTGGGRYWVVRNDRTGMCSHRVVINDRTVHSTGTYTEGEVTADLRRYVMDWTGRPLPLKGDRP